MLDVLAGFIQELRAAGLPVSLTEDVDTMDAVRHVALEDREAFKHALGATLVKSHGHWQAFETVFEVYFALRPALTGDLAGELTGEMVEDADELPEEADLAALLEAALEAGDEDLLRALAAMAVTRSSGMQAGRPVGGTYYLYRTLRSLDLDGALARLLARAGAAGGLEERLARDEMEARIDRFESEVEAEIRRRLVADRGPDALARTVRRPLPEDVDFMHASREDLVALRKALHPLARKLAVRLARRRRHRRRGPLDFRSTVRHSLSYGGVPAEPRFRHPRPAKPEIMVIADVSGSVAAFARFTLHLVYAISAQ
ncbi:MAG: VWA domain-containing protein, partial [Acidimicrobiales bacterium]